MGWFDWYEPGSTLTCPVCDTSLTEWQGKNGPCGLFVWRQGSAAPVEQKIEKDISIEVEKREKMRLPDEFIIYSHGCSCPFPVLANGRCNGGIWMETELVTSQNAVQLHHETEEQFTQRKQWLEGTGTGAGLALGANVQKRIWSMSVLK